MNKRLSVKILGWILVSFFTVIGCSQLTSNTDSQAVELTVSAAASMQDAMKEVA
ncbi:hypothetical protein [Calothrix sp. CCY 0018]|uniref:hypothetical protein n=1 Tax=Calothrix sp. CCY 0018 TaxID=3103864 RepID=UPI0039C5DFCE